MANDYTVIFSEINFKINNFVPEVVSVLHTDESIQEIISTANERNCEYFSILDVRSTYNRTKPYIINFFLDKHGNWKQNDVYNE